MISNRLHTVASWYKVKYDLIDDIFAISLETSGNSFYFHASDSNKSYTRVPTCNSSIILEYSDYLLIGDKGVHYKLVGRIKGILMRLNIKSVNSLMLIEPPDTINDNELTLWSQIQRYQSLLQSR
jgi:hypothetical protein